MCSQFLCAGLRIAFDQPLQLQPTFGLAYGFTSGFELWPANFTPFSQPVSLTGLWPGDATGATVQLNFTWTISGTNATTLWHAWHDYPVIFATNAAGQPIAPFNITIPAITAAGVPQPIPQPW